MTRQADIKWFEAERAKLASEHAGKWLVVYQAKLVKVFDEEEEAVEFSVSEYGINMASVFHAVAKDPYLYIG